MPIEPHSKKCLKIAGPECWARGGLPLRSVRDLAGRGALHSPGWLKIRPRFFCALVGILLQLVLVASDGRAQERQRRAPVEQQGAAPMRDLNELVAVRVDGIGLHLQSSGSIRSIGAIQQPGGQVLILLAGHRSGKLPRSQDFPGGSIKRIELQGGGDGEMALTRILVTPRQPGKFRLYTTGGGAWLRWTEPGPSLRLAEETGPSTPETPLLAAGPGLRSTVVLNVRIGPSRKSTRIDQLSPGQVVEELRREGSWVRVRFGERAGWVHGGYLDAAPEPEELVAEQAAAAQPGTTEETPVSTAPAVELSESAVKTPEADRAFSLASWLNDVPESVQLAEELNLEEDGVQLELTRGIRGGRDACLGAVALPGGGFLPTISARNRLVATDESVQAADVPALVSADVVDLVVPLPADDGSDVPAVERVAAVDMPAWAAHAPASMNDMSVPGDDVSVPATAVSALAPAYPAPSTLPAPPALLALPDPPDPLDMAGSLLVSAEDMPALVADVLAPAGGLPAPTADRRMPALTADRHAPVDDMTTVAVDVVEASSSVRFLRSTVALNVRTKPSTASLSIAVLDPSQLVAELYREGDWARVGFPGGIGWSHGDYLVAAGSEPEARFKQVTEAVNLWGTPRATWPTAVLFPGQLIEELGRQGDTVRVRSAKGIGWVESQSLGAASEQAVLAHEAQTKTDVSSSATYRSLRNTVALNVRTGPNSASWRLDLLYPGQRVEELDREGDWVKVRFTGGTGWVHGDYLAPLAPRTIATQMQTATLEAASDHAFSSKTIHAVEPSKSAVARETTGES